MDNPKTHPWPSRNVTLHETHDFEGPKAKFIWKKHTLDLLSMINNASHGQREMEMGTGAEMSGYGNENDQCDGDGSNEKKAGKKGEE